MANTNIADGKMIYHADRVYHNQAPITADIFLTNFCNNKCPYCTYRRWEFDTGARYLGYDDFVKYATRMIELGVRGFILTGGGEPTLSPDFDKITDWLQANNLHYGINTNFNKIKYIKPDYLKVSLDGWDEKSYSKSRGVEKYEVVRYNIRKYLEWKSENSPKTAVGIQMVAENIDDVLQFYEANKDLDVTYMSIRPMESTNGSYYKSPDHSDYLKIYEFIKRLQEIDSRVVPNFKWTMVAEQEETCIANWSQIAINEIGEVLYCCHKPYQIVGHIMDEDILEKKKQASTDMSMCDIPCRLTAPNKEVATMLSSKKDVYFI